MGSKKNARGMQLDGEIYHNYRRAVVADGWRHGLAAKAEDLLKDYADAVFAKQGLKWEKLPMQTLEGKYEGVAVRLPKHLRDRKRPSHHK